jgi:hypothetical protein
MVFYYVVRDVVRGADCSYKPGRTLLDCVQRTPEKARELADRFNRHCHVAGVFYLVIPHDDGEPFSCDHFEHGGSRLAALGV